MDPRLILFAPFLALSSGCDQRRVPADRPHTLAGEVIATGAFLDQPKSVAVAGGRVVVLDRSAPMVHVFGLPNGRHLGSFGQKGEGPGEYRSVRHAQRDARDPRDAWIYDLPLRRMTRVRFGPAPVPEVQEVLNLHNGAGVFLHPVWLTDTTLVVAAISPQHTDGRLLLTDRTGEIIRTLGQAPRHPASAAIPPTVLQHAYEGPVTVSPDRSRFAIATRQADRLEIYRSDGTLVAQVAGSTGFLPAFEVRHRAEGVSMALGEDLRAGYVDLASTGDRIYALFSGRLKREAGAETFFGRELHVFDWSGELLGRAELDAPALAFAVAPDGRQVFAVRHSPEPAVVRYELPPPLAGR